MNPREIPLEQIKPGKSWRTDTGKDLGGLQQSIQEKGLLHPIVVDADYRLVVGYRRYLAAMALDWKTILVLVLPEAKENAQKRKLANLKKGRQKPEPQREKSERGDSRDQAAKAVGMSGRQLEKILEMLHAAEEDSDYRPLIQRMDELGRVSGIYKAAKALGREKEIKASMPDRIFAGNYRVELDKFVCGDSREILPDIPAATFDAVMADFPYGVGVNYDGWQEPGKQGAGRSSAKDYRSFLEPLYTEILRVAKPGAFICIFQSQIYFPYLWEWFERDGIEINIFIAARNWIPYTKNRNRILRSYDPAVIFYKPGGPPLEPGCNGRNKDFFMSKMRFDPLAHWDCHPCVKGLDLIRYLLTNFVARTALVLDPCCGLGTTGIAINCCNNDPEAKSQRHFVCIDRSAKYIQRAEERYQLMPTWADVARLCSSRQDQQ